MPPDRPVTRILEKLREGHDGAFEELIEVVQGELRRLAGIQMARQPAGHTLQPTALVNEACLKLLGSGAAFTDRNHFLNAAARAMRSVLVDHARARGRKKRGAGAARVTLRESSHGSIDPGEEVLAVHEALAKLESVHPRKARVVELRYFAGLTVEETAAAMEVTERTVYRLWDRARAWLLLEMEQ